MIALPRVVPGGTFLGGIAQIWATTRAELAMQWRRWGLWVAFGVTTGLLLLLTVQTALYLTHLPPTSLYVRLHYAPENFNNLMVYGGTAYGVMFSGLLAALLVVDRMGRDQQLGIRELQRASPQGTLCYVLGKFLGNIVALLVPIFLAYLLCALVTILLGWPVALLLKFLLVFLLVFVPSSLAAVSLALWLSSFLPLRVVQVGFSLLWFECNIGLGWHGLVFSIFNPNGFYVYPLLTPLPGLQSVDPSFHTSVQLALLNILVLLLIAILAFFLTWASLATLRLREEGA
jgi:hypothetical protein